MKTRKNEWKIGHICYVQTSQTYWTATVVSQRQFRVHQIRAQMKAKNMNSPKPKTLATQRHSKPNMQSPKLSNIKMKG